MIFNLILLISSRVSNIFNYSIYGILSSYLKLKLKLKKKLLKTRDYCYLLSLIFVIQQNKPKNLRFNKKLEKKIDRAYVFTFFIDKEVY